MVMSSNKIGRRAMKATQTGIDDILKSAQTSARATVESDMKADDTIKKAAAPQKAQTFGEAFKAARRDKGPGETFTWFGKSYSTNMAGEGAKKTSGRSGTGSSTASTPTKNLTGINKPTGSTSTPTVNPAFFKKREGAPTGAAGVKTSASKASAPAPKVDTPKDKPKRDNTAAGRRARFADMLGAPGRFAASLYTGVPSGKTPPMGKRNPILKVGEEARKANKGTIGGKAKGGSIDGCAIRGKTRAPMKKGK